MKLHEFQAKEIFAKYGVPIPRGKVAFTAEEACETGRSLGGFPVVVKAQIHAGGRGKGGGVKLAGSEAELAQVAGEIVGMRLVTPQTGAGGRLVRKVLVEEGLDIDREMYLSIMPDRATAQNLIMASSAGGMDIETVAEETPEKIIKTYVDPLMGVQPHHLRRTAFKLGLSGAGFKGFCKSLAALYKLFTECDASLVEINPLVLTVEEKVVALDAKMDIDGNAMFRQPDILKYRDEDEEDPCEAEASKYNLNYINLDGNIGNMVNGAGLAMATMDIIKQAGGEPANFLDVGGGANAEMVENGFRIILKDPNVKGILINIFGGILRCDVLAKGVVEAAGKTGIRVPVVIRMEGTNVEEGRRILEESGLNLTAAADLKDAAEKISGLAA